VDVADPTREELLKIATEYGLSSFAVEDCLNPRHQPKYERIQDRHFVILRHADSSSYPSRSDTITELTRKVAIFFDHEVIVTIHRKPQGFFERVATRLSNLPDGKSTAGPLVELFHAVIQTFEQPIAWVEEQFDQLETHIFSQSGPAFQLEDLYFLKRKVSIFRRMLRENIEVLSRSVVALNGESSEVQNIREDAERHLHWAEELIEVVTALLTIHISLASHRTNETMRVLTIFSAFFMPLTFIVGVYGMNFEFMPELTSPIGYPAVWAVMIAITAGIYGWFRINGWVHFRRRKKQYYFAS
jgi:magnesium transporter